jgi:PD-(D/E)XK nuclease superfamily protein
MIHQRDTEDTEGSSCHITHDIVGGAIEVHRRFGPRLLEAAYETCLCRELLLRGIHFQQLTNLHLGLLINFNVEVLRSGLYRIING